MNLNDAFKLKISEDKIGPFLLIPPALKRALKLKKGKEVTAKIVSNKGKLTFEITPN